MRDFEPITKTEAWVELKAGAEVRAVDFEQKEVYELGDCTVREVLKIMEGPNVACCKRKGG